MALFNFYVREYEGTQNNVVEIHSSSLWVFPDLYNSFGTSGGVYCPNSARFRPSECKITGSMGYFGAGKMYTHRSNLYSIFHTGLVGTGGWSASIPNPNYDFESFRTSVLTTWAEKVIDTNDTDPDPLRNFRTWNAHFLNRQVDGTRFFVIFYPGNDPQAEYQVDIDV